MAPTVSTIENRGTDEDPFGFIYFDEPDPEGKPIRLGYERGTIWQANWGAGSPAHFALAWQALVNANVSGYNEMDLVSVRIDNSKVYQFAIYELLTT